MAIDPPIATTRPPIGQEIGGPGKAYFDSVVTDNIMEALVELAAEVWTTRDRLTILEAVLAERGIEAAALVEAYVPSDAMRAARKTMREAFIAQVFASFTRRPS